MSKAKEIYRRRIVIYNFNEITFELETQEMLRTKPLTEHEFRRVLKRELKGRKNFCYIVEKCR